MTGSKTLGAITVQYLDVHCTKCDRRSVHQVSDLLAKYGPATVLPDLLSLLSKDCPKRANVSIYDRCGVGYASVPA